ncbi:hypothetical protein BGW80DRAFT_498866 [Lactifluus volemus]|nr:hypothetical protein BGW80DRAFT_498866 [Lactifluus volemus]
MKLHNGIYKTTVYFGPLGRVTVPLAAASKPKYESTAKREPAQTGCVCPKTPSWVDWVWSLSNFIQSNCHWGGGVSNPSRQRFCGRQYSN